MTTGIYEAVFHSSWKVDDLRIDDDKFEAARRGDTSAQNHVILRYKGKLRNVYGEEKCRQLPRIYWDDKFFDIHRTGDAKSPVPKPTRRSKAGPSGECNCNCVMCDIGYHCHESDHECTLRP